MRHRKAGVHLSRTAAHRKALFSNLVAALIEHESIRTTHAKARATRRVAERTITLARRVGDVLQKAPDQRSAEENARVVHAMRTARSVVRNRDAVQKLFDQIGPRYIGRHGGYTRIVKLGDRPGDAAPVSLLELMPDTAPAGKAEKSDAGPAAKGTKGAKAGKAASAKAEKADKPAKAEKAAGKGGKTARAAE